MRPFAFISYSRSDANVAIDLHKKIEKYIYPTEWVAVENRPELDKYVRPIFLDLTDLSAQDRNFTDEIKDNLKYSRYLIVLCSEHSAKSPFVQNEINYFLQTHNHDASLIVAVYIDKIFSGMHPVIDEIVATRNCPIYVTGKGEAGHTGRKYCFYHLLEFLLKVDFDKLYNRYEAYKQRKHRQKVSLISFIVALLIGVTTHGWYTQTKRAEAEAERAEAEAERAKVEHARVRFEMGVFPYSLVVGYVENFLQPTMQALNDSCPQKPHMIVYMPYDSLELDNRVRSQKYDGFIQSHYDSCHFITENVQIPNRPRASSVSRLILPDNTCPIYKDDARTVTAFRSVIKYKLSKKNPVPVPPRIREKFTQLYTDSFIVYAQQELGPLSSQVHFVRDTTELSTVLNRLLTTP